VLFFTMLAIYQQIVNEGEDERRHLKETLRQQDEEVARANAAMNRAVAALKDINNTLDSCTDERS
jgi:chromosome segregation ATPase